MGICTSSAIDDQKSTKNVGKKDKSFSKTDDRSQSQSQSDRIKKCLHCSYKFENEYLDALNGVCENCSKTQYEEGVESNCVSEDEDAIKHSCSKCNKSVKENALPKYEGLCKKCYSTRKSNCSKCEKEYTQLTLDKRDGVCGRCHKKAIQDGKVIDNKYQPCKNCTKKFLKTTLAKNNGLCGKCHKKVGSGVKNSRTLSQAVWHKDFGVFGVGICKVCRITEITPFTFELGHDLADSKGGERSEDNLWPICRTCNMSQGNLTFDEFKSSLPTVKIQEIDYDERIIILNKWAIGNEKYDRLSPRLRHDVAIKDNNYKLFLDVHDNVHRVKINKGFTGLKFKKVEE
jgi:hypothetical protein